jgi:hypothetical protein
MESRVAHKSDGSPGAAFSPARCKKLPKRAHAAAGLQARAAKAAHPLPI